MGEGLEGFGEVLQGCGLKRVGGFVFSKVHIFVVFFFKKRFYTLKNSKNTKLKVWGGYKNLMQVVCDRFGIYPKHQDIS